MNLASYLASKKEKIDRTLDTILPKPDEYPEIIHRAMRYSVFAGGKRLRPILALASAEAVGGKEEEILPIACSLELIHTYSLIHDDLPAMDNDDFRRGKPTSHRVFGEAIAILAGDALLTLAFEQLAAVPEDLVPPKRKIKVIKEIASASGSRGMVGGQVVDIESEGKKVNLPTVTYIHQAKTGRLITASVRIGGIVAGATPSQLDALSVYGENVGLAFQIIDDILDITGSKEKLGKEVAKDAIRGKATYPGVVGIAEAKKRAFEAAEEAIKALSQFGEAARPLREIAKFIISRET
ncbi:MAG: polyprenyl synthetase family protein [Acidobacteria bacterium]|nr:polyprenyl synthetase family protein [Acidobacteriota bacterium]